MALEGYGYGLRHSIVREMWAVSVKDYRNLYCLPRFLWSIWMKYIERIRTGKLKVGLESLVFIIIRFSKEIGDIG